MTSADIASGKRSALESVSAPRAAGYLALGAFFGGFVWWGVTMPLAGAAIASGNIAVAGENQTIQHLEGGIISEIHIHEGEQVKKGDPLFTLDATQSQSEADRLEKRAVALRARAARLSAERDEASKLDFSDELTAAAERFGLGDVLEEQRKEFQTRRTRIASEMVILEQRIAAQYDAIEGFKSQQKAIEEQIAVIGDEIKRKERLLNQGLTNRNEYSALLRAQADLIGRSGSYTAELARADNQIIEAQEQIARQRSAVVEETLRTLNDVRVELTEIEERLAATSDIVQRSVVRSPSDGLIIRIVTNTPGSVVRPGGDLATLLPTTSELVVSARLTVNDIDAVRPGQNATLRMVALNSRRTPEVPAEVIFVSPDRFVDEATRQPYYVARLRITELPPEISEEQVYPGMPVEALISTEERTFADYLVRPLMDSMALAFREE